MPISAGESSPNLFSMLARFTVRRSTTSPAAVRPCTSNTFLAMSSPIMIACFTDGPLSLDVFNQNQCGTLMPGGGRPHHHPERSEGPFLRLQRPLASLGVTTATRFRIGGHSLVGQHRVAEPRESRTGPGQHS